MKKKTTIISLLILILYLFTCFSIQSNSLDVTEYIVESDKIEEEITIVQISDFHNDKRYIDVLSEKILILEPDYIVITGDLITYYNPRIDVSIQLVEKIQDVAPIYFVQGNHEYFSSCYSELKEQLLEKNVVILEDEMIETDTFNIIGLLDASDTVVNVENDKFTLLLAHRPELFEKYVEMNVDLVLSGHTHGGQICLPFLGGFYAPNQGFFPKYLAGKYQSNNTTMIISRGIGNGKIPFRLFNNPELVVIKLQ